MIRHLSPTIKLLALPALGALLTGLLFGFLSYSIMRERGTVASLETKLASEKTKELSLKAARLLLADMGDGAPGLGSYYLGAEGVAPFIEEIEGIGRKAGIETLLIHSVTLQPLAAGSIASMEELRLAVQAEGDWGEAVRFLSMLESLPLPVSFSSVTLEKRQGESGMPAWGIATTIEVAKFKP